jgi:2-keto-myo-inositol isomerase
MTSRRHFISTAAMISAGLSIPALGQSKQPAQPSDFRYCLNTSTISGQNPGLLKYIEIASRAGYDGIELWVRDVKTHLDAGNSAASVKKIIADSGLRVENAIGFAPWISGGDAGMQQMKEEMEMMASIGCLRIAAPPAGVPDDKPLDLFMAGEKYAQVLELGRQTGVMPQLEFWGASKVMWHLGQTLMVAAASNDADARLLPDVYHLFRGDSGFEGLKMLNGKMIEIFHMNDYPGTKPRTEQVDGDRVFPGDGVAPIEQILADLKHMGGEKVLSLELFNRSYWERDALEVATIGLQKMKSLVKKIE